MKANRFRNQVSFQAGLCGLILACSANVWAEKKQSQAFSKPIDSAGQASAQDTQALQAILDLPKDKNLPADAKLKQRAHQQWIEAEIERLEQFVTELPASAWSPSLKVNLGKYYRQNGGYSQALQHWEEAWQATKLLKENEGKEVADEALVYWTRMLASLGRVETLSDVLNQTKGRVLDRGPLSQMFSRTLEGYAGMIKRPGMAYKCGVYALHNVALALKGSDYNAPGLTREPSTPMGFTLEALSQLSDRYSLGLVPLKREQGEALVVPSVVHWRQNHYAAIVGQTDDLYQVVDPTFESTLYMSAQRINAEASGWFLVPAQQQPPEWRKPSVQEQRQVFGRGYPYILQDKEDRLCLTGCPPGCPPGMNEGSCQGCDNPVPKGPGMPWWRVSEPYLNLWLHDSPLGYQPAFGPAISFDLSFKQRDEAAGGLPGYSSVGYGWNCSWLSYVVTSQATTHTSDVELFLPGGGAPHFHFDNGVAIDYLSNLRLIYLTNGAGTVSSYELLFADGSKLVYAFQRFNSSGLANYFFLSKKIDPQGNEVRFEYEPYSPQTQIVRLKRVIDASGNITTLNYVNSGPNPNLISSVIDPWGRIASLSYTFPGGAAELLTQITDVASMTSTIAYDTQGWPVQLSTPYGFTTFQAYTSWDFIQYNIDRALTVTQPGGGKHLYVFRLDCSGFMASSYPASLVPQGTPLGTVDNQSIHMRNSFYWDPKQITALSTQAPENLSGADYLKARMRHWLGDSGHGDKVDTLALERNPSPDGTTQGQLTWYDYLSKGPGGNDDQGTQVLPALIARRLQPNGPTWYAHYTRDNWGRPVSITSTYGNGTATRAQSYLYASNGIDLLEERGPNNQIRRSYTYNAYHQPLSVSEAVDSQTTYTSSFTYDPATQQITSILRPDGTTVTFTYNGDRRLIQRSEQPINRVDSYNYYSNGLPYSHTDPRGLVRTFYWDNLQRLTQINFPDGTFIQHIYNWLDRSATRDRMGNWTYFYYNALRQLTSQVDPLSRTTRYTYCPCGALESITDALNQSTTFLYDWAGRRTRILYPGGTREDFTYDLLGQLIENKDNSGNVVAGYSYNNQGLLIAVTNPFGQVSSIDYDVEDRPISVNAAGGPSVSQAFDLLGRMTSRTVTGGGTETFTYSALGPLTSRDALNQATIYSYDLANRKITVTNPKNESNQFTYNAAGDLLTLIDGKNQTTRWTYDTEGRVTTKNQSGTQVMSAIYDGNGRMFWRWTPANGNANFYYDTVGNLTYILYSNSPSVSYSYDALNRLIYMSDAVGTTAFSYTSFGALAEENPPWSNDSVNYYYDQNRRRSRMTQLKPDGSAWTQDYAYDSAGRLQSILSPAGTFTYTYSGASGLVTRIGLPTGGAISKTYDALARLTSTALGHSSGSTLNVHSYLYNNAHQRTRQSRGGNYVNYGYDAAGQLSSVEGFENNGTRRWHEKLSYSYDASGNLTQRANNNLNETLTVGWRNQLSSGAYSGALTVAGMGEGPISTLNVNGQPGTLYGDGSFSVADLSLTGNYTASAQGSAGNTATDTVWISTLGFNYFSYDANGNMLGDGSRSFAYDDENQLKQATVSGLGWVEYTYDGLHRKRVRREYNASGQFVKYTRYYYDGMQVDQERDLYGQVIASYTRGLDLSGSLDGAGGIGGLLARTDGSGNAYYHSDGTGNVTMLINASQQVVAKYLYDPFGNLLGSSGSLAEANIYRFSSKEYDPKTGLYYYGFRFYDPNFQRWINQDPLGEAGGVNLYGFVGNGPINRNDPFGLFSPRAHDFLYAYTFSDVLPKSEITIMQEAGKAFDKRTQAPSQAYLHSMRMRRQSPAEAIQLRNQFILGTLNEAKKIACSDRERALELFAEAMHPVQDSYSPEHRDKNGNPKIWNPWWPFGHSPNDWLGSETLYDIPSISRGEVSDYMKKAYKYVFGK